MKTRLTLVLFLVLAGRALAQEATNELLAAPQVRDFVVLQPNGTKLEYQVDGFATENFKPFPAGAASFVAGRPINLFIHDFNPFVLSVTSTQSQSDDTSFASVQKFIDALTGLGRSIGVPPPTTTAGAAGAMGLRISGDKCEKTLQSSAAVAAWDQLTRDASCRQPVRDLFCDAGALIYEDVDLNLKKKLKDWREGSTSYSAIFTGVNSVQGEIQDKKKILDARIKDAATSLEILPGKAAAEILKPSWSPDCTKFTNLTKATAVQLIQDGNEILAKKTLLSESLKSLGDMLDKYKDRFLWDQAGTSFRFASVEPSFDKIQTVVVTINQRKFDDSKEPIAISEVKLSQSTLRVRHHSPFVPEVAVGMAASELRVPKFGTAQKDGKTVVATAGSDYLRTIPSLFFNGIVRFRAESFAYPMFQLGVGTGADRPSFLAGIGLRFTRPRHLAVSAGWAVTWFKDLDKLKLGDEVKGTADVEGDLKLRRSSAEPYISIQYSF